MKPELRFEQKEVKAAQLGEESCVPDLSGEVILQNQLAFCLDEEDEIYEGYGRVRNGYPYRLRNGYTRERQMKMADTAVLENDYLKAVFLTGFGGRLWELWDKETGENLLYTNDVLLFGNLAVRGAWFSGGVEWNVGVIGHTPFTTEKIYVACTEDDKGNPVLRMYEYERIREVAYQMDFWLEEDSRFLNCRMRLVNEHVDVIPMYWWSNIAVPEFEGGKIYVPAKTAFTHDEVRVTRVDIPIVNGIDVTEYKKIPSSVDYFFDIPEKEPKYIINVNPQGHGLLQYSTSRLRSRKLFSWGHKAASGHWQEFLTEKAGPYIEIQAGLGKTQFGCIPMAPHTAWEWMEQYGPVRKEVSEIEEELRNGDTIQRLEEKLKATKPMAKKRAKLVQAGSGYATLLKRGESTAHLEFVDEKGTYTGWKQFIEGGRLAVPNPQDRPDVFLYDKTSFARLKEAVKQEERKNWYARYQLGVRYYVAEKYKKAKKQFEKSLELAENAWALHGLSCAEYALGNQEKAVKYILRGSRLQKEELSYQKEGFKMLDQCKAYKEICRFYPELSEELKKDSRLKYYYITALHRLGKDKEAFALMEENGGLVVDDLRECDDTIAELWSEMYESLYGEKGEVPYRYLYRAH